MSFGLAAATAFWLGRSFPAHRPIARILPIALLLDLARLGLRAAFAPPPRALDRALFLAFPLLSIALAGRVLGGLRWATLARALGGTWIVLAAIVTVLAPSRSTFEALALRVHLVAIAAELVAAGVLLRRWRVPNTAELVALLLGAADLGALAGPWLRGHPARDWDLERWPWAATYLVIAIVQSKAAVWARSS